jgi:hypothetical protein
MTAAIWGRGQRRTAANDGRARRRGQRRPQANARREKEKIADAGVGNQRSAAAAIGDGDGGDGDLTWRHRRHRRRRTEDSQARRPEVASRTRGRKREKVTPAAAATLTGDGDDGGDGDLRRGRELVVNRRAAVDAERGRRRAGAKATRTSEKKKECITGAITGRFKSDPLSPFSPLFLVLTQSKYIPGSTTGFAGISSKAGHQNTQLSSQKKVQIIHIRLIMDNPISL